MIDGAESHWSERRLNLDLLRRSDQLVGVGRSGLSEDRGERLHHGIADDRAKARIVVVLVLIGLKEGRMLGNFDIVPGIAGDNPASRRLALEGIEIFRLAGQETDDRT